MAVLGQKRLVLDQYCGDDLRVLLFLRYFGCQTTGKQTADDWTWRSAWGCLVNPAHFLINS
jgi:hypothetical protein